MTKRDVAERIVSVISATKSGQVPTVQQTEAVINAFFEVIKESVADGKKVQFRGFGNFGPKIRRAKTARDLKAGKTIQVPETVLPFFKPSEEFRAQVAASETV